jgi:hypothetical protein
MSAKLGIDAKAYYNTGTYGSPTWVEITSIRDLAGGAVWDTVEAPSRAERVKKMAKTLAGVSHSGNIKVSNTEATYIYVWEKAISGTGNMDLMVLNGAHTVNGSRGYRYDALVTTNTEDQGIGTALYIDVEFMPDAFGVNPVKTAVVATGAPVFTTLAA